MSTTQIKLPCRGIVVRAPQDLQVPQVVALFLDVKMSARLQENSEVKFTKQDMT